MFFLSLVNDFLSSLAVLIALVFLFLNVCSMKMEAEKTELQPGFCYFNNE